jgi:hypothetical protein
LIGGGLVIWLLVIGYLVIGYWLFGYWLFGYFDSAQDKYWGCRVIKKPEGEECL